MSDTEQLIENARAITGEIDPNWKLDEHETAEWTLLAADILALIEAIEHAKAKGAAKDEYEDLIVRAAGHAKDLNEEWFITGTAADGNMLYGELARWAALAHAIWDLTEVLLALRGDDLEHSPHAFSHGS